jgi:L-2-hydroxyglutarate oxidase
MTVSSYDVAVIGGGIVGAATAHALTRRPGLSLILLEAENTLAAHQTGNNSGVIHAGLYYKPGSLKARNCVEGREALYRFCQEYGVTHDNCGKVVVATESDEIPRLEELERRGNANGLKGLVRLDSAGIREHEPHAAGIAGLFVPQTGIVDYKQVTETLGRLTREAGGQIDTSRKFLGCRRESDGLILETTQGEVRAKNLINCGGLYSDRVARLCGLDPKVQIVPFRGEYFELVPERQFLVKNLIYPVPDPRFPFLGVHFTRMAKGGIEAGPNAVLALKREGYTRTSISLRDLAEMARYPGLWRMAWKYWRTGFGEMYRSLSKGAFCRALQRLVPELRLEDIHPAGAGVRAQALGRDGSLVDDFAFVEAERMIHVLNAPSPAATSCLSIGKTIAEMAEKNFALSARN